MNLNIVSLALKIALINILLLFVTSSQVMAWTVAENITEVPPLVLEDPLAKAEDELKIQHNVLKDIKKLTHTESKMQKTVSVEKPLGQQPPASMNAVTTTNGPLVGFQKNPSALTEEEDAVKEHLKACDLIKRGKEGEAEIVLFTSLIKTPTHHASRAELATLYLKKEQDKEAEKVLSEGLKLAESNPQFLKLMAIIHERWGEPEKALSLLEKISEEKRYEKNTVALLGHLYQQTGRYNLARQQYAYLMQTEPKNPLWLLGLSIALESEGKREAALEGYQKLEREMRVEPDILTYIKERIECLKG